VPRTYTQKRHNAVNDYWRNYGKERVLVYCVDDGNNNIFANSSAAAADKRTTVLSILGINYIAPGNHGTTARITENANDQATAIFRYLTEDGPFGPTAGFANFRFYVDGASTGVDRESLPATAIPIIFDANFNAVLLFVDPANGVVFIGDSQTFDEGSTAADAIAGNADAISRFRLNLVAYVVNAAQYGSSFTSLFLPGNEALYDAAFQTR
jgi:hypothetical protein